MNQAELHLQGLKYQLSSHFLFNVLNTVRVLIRKDAAKAGDLITLLSEYLRYSLHKLDHFYSTLNEEKAGVELFLQLQEVRFHTKIISNWEIPESLLAAKIPSLILQPLVESIYKQTAKNENGMQVLHISATEKNEKLLLTISTPKTVIIKENSRGFVPKSDVEAGVEQVHILFKEVYGPVAEIKTEQTGSEKKILVQIPFEI